MRNTPVLDGVMLAMVRGVYCHSIAVPRLSTTSPITVKSVNQILELSFLVVSGKVMRAKKK